MPRVNTSLKVIRCVWASFATLVLAACETAPKFPPACPSLALLRDAADLTRYSPGGHDIRALTVDARITGAPATCSFDTSSKVKATLQVDFRVTRGPAASGRGIALPYFVAVTQGGRILDEQDYVVAGAFPASSSEVDLKGEQGPVLLPITKDRSAAAYQVYVGFRLSPDELAINRQRGPR